MIFYSTQNKLGIFMNWLLQILIIAVFTILFVFALHTQSGQIQQDLSSRVSQHLSEKNFTQVAYKVDGRDIHLKGKVPVDHVRRELIQDLEDLWGARSVRASLDLSVASSENEASSIPEVEPYNTVFVLSEKGELKLQGYAPSSKDLEKIETAIEEFAFLQSSKNELKLARGQAKNWDQAIAASLEAIKYLDHGTAGVIDELFYLEGFVSDQATLDAIKKQVGVKLPKGLSRNIKVKISSPVLDEQALNCQTGFDRLLKKDTIHFRIGSARLHENSFGLLNEIADVANSCPGARLAIIGHTDSSGDLKLNKNLSLMRARTTLAYLSGRGLPYTRMRAIGMGESRPIASNATEAGRYKNRRIEIKVEE